MAKTFNVRNFAISVLRKGSYRLAARYECLKEAKIARNQYRCNICKGIFGRRDIQIDHIIPIVPTEGWDSFDNYIERLYCDKSGLQVLCKKKCHKIKSKNENMLRKFHRDAKKKKMEN